MGKGHDGDGEKSTGEGRILMVRQNRIAEHGHNDATYARVLASDVLEGRVRSNVILFAMPDYET